MNKTIDTVKEKLNDICQITDDYKEEFEGGEDLEDESLDLEDILSDVQIDFNLLDDESHNKELIIKYNNPYVLLRFLLDYICYIENQQTIMSQQNPDINYIENHFVYQKDLPISNWTFDEIYNRLAYTNISRIAKFGGGLSYPVSEKYNRVNNG